MNPTRALVIDDEQIVLNSVSRILTEDSFEVDTSLRGRDGLAKALEDSAGFSINFTLRETRSKDGPESARVAQDEEPASGASRM